MLIGGDIGQVKGRGMCRSARDTLLTTVLDTSPFWWEPLILTPSRETTAQTISLRDFRIPTFLGPQEGM